MICVNAVMVVFVLHIKLLLACLEVDFLVVDCSFGENMGSFPILRALLGTRTN